MKTTLPLALALTLWSAALHADDFTDSIVANLRDLGYGYIEIKNGIGQVKVEAVRGTEKLEVIYDRATGEILKQENERADAEDLGRSGVDISTRNRDLLGDDDHDDDRDDEDDDGDEDEDDDDDDEDDD